MGAKGTRSRNGCKSCKKLKIKCDEKKPKCSNCIKKHIDVCDYSIVLQWGGRPYKNRQNKTKKLPNTVVIDGIVTVKEHKKDACKNSSQSTELILIDEKFQSVPNFEDPSLELDIPEVFSPSFKKLTAEPDISSSATVFGLSSPNPIDLFSLHLPLPLPDALTSSPYYTDLFDFFLKETANLFVPAPQRIYDTNPFNTLLPQMAMQNSTLLNLMLAFAANHRNKILTFQDDPMSLPLDEIFNFNVVTSDGTLANELLTKTFNELLSTLMDSNKRNSDSTLATILLLAAFDIFFSDTRNKWRAHVYGARKIMMQKLEINSSGNLAIPHHGNDCDPQFFLSRWFSYIDIISSLSSANAAMRTKKLSSLSYEFSYLENEKLIEGKRLKLQDIEYFTGMDARLLSFLAEVASIVDKRESCNLENIPHGILLNTLELDHEITNHLRLSEVERDKVYEKYYGKKTGWNTNPKYEAYSTLRATNMIFGLTGVLQLKRRVLGIPQHSKIVKDLLLTITHLIETRIPLSSSAECCILFCLFCCGCELIDESLRECREVYMAHIDALSRRGMSSALQAKYIMQECWSQRKLWWDILREKNLDITFAV